jgi:hypothetical protein
MSTCLYDSSVDSNPLASSPFAKRCIKFFETLTSEYEPATHLYIFQCKVVKNPVWEVGHDDGNLHITHNPTGTHVCFDVQHGQNLSAKETNENTRAVLTALKMERFIGERTLLDESEDEDDEVCECCGRRN